MIERRMMMDNLRHYYEFLHEKDFSKYPEFKSDIRLKIHKIEDCCVDRLAKGLSEDVHYVVDSDEGGVTEFRIYQGDDCSDAEWKDFFDEQRISLPHSPYDCTGRPFTCRMHYKKLASGNWSFVHHIALDI